MRVKAMSALTVPYLMVDRLDELRDIIINLRRTSRRSTELIYDEVIFRIILRIAYRCRDTIVDGVVATCDSS